MTRRVLPASLASLALTAPVAAEAPARIQPMPTLREQADEQRVWWHERLERVLAASERARIPEHE